jgi:hypothetical protein
MFAEAGVLTTWSCIISETKIGWPLPERTPILVPQGERCTLEALEQGDSSDGGEPRVIPKYIRQPIIGDSTAQVMDVVNADVRPEPTQDTRQMVVRTAMQRCFVKTPGRIEGLGRVLELVLDISTARRQSLRQNHVGRCTSR